MSLKSNLEMIHLVKKIEKKMTKCIIFQQNVR